MGFSTIPMGTSWGSWPAALAPHCPLQTLLKWAMVHWIKYLSQLVIRVHVGEEELGCRGGSILCRYETMPRVSSLSSQQLTESKSLSSPQQPGPLNHCPDWLQQELVWGPQRASFMGSNLNSHTGTSDQKGFRMILCFIVAILKFLIILSLNLCFVSEVQWNTRSREICIHEGFTSLLSAR